MRSVFKISCCVMLFFLGSGRMAFAQNEKIRCAIDHLKSSRLDSARMCIDAAAMDSLTSKQAQTWYLRGFIYKEIYRSREADNVKSPARMEALNSFKKSVSLDTANANRDANMQNLHYIAVKFYNDCAITMDTLKYKFSIENYENYKEVSKLVDPKMDFKQADIAFYNALGTVYNKIFESDKKNKAPYLELAKATFSKVLSLDPDNSSANYNLGILYFNQAVDIINAADYDIDIVALSDLQDNSISLFRQSLPFMEKANTLDPDNKLILEGLSGIYFSLNDYEKSKQFKEKIEELKNRK